MNHLTCIGVETIQFFSTGTAPVAVKKSNASETLKQTNKKLLNGNDSAPVDESPKSSPKANKKKQKNQQPNATLNNASPDKSVKTPKKSKAVVPTAVVETDDQPTKTPVKSNQKKGSPSQLKQKNLANVTVDQAKLVTPKKPSVNQNTEVTNGNSTKKSAAKAKGQLQEKTPKKSIDTNSTPTPQQSKTPKKQIVDDAQATPKQSKTPKKQIVNDVEETPKQSKTPKKQIVDGVKSTPKQSKTPKQPVDAVTIPVTPQQSKTPKKQTVDDVKATPKQSKTPKQPVDVSATPQQSKTPKKQIVDDVKATPKQSQTPKNKNNTPGVTAKTPQSKQPIQTPKSSKQSKQNSSPSAKAVDDQQKPINQKKNVKRTGKVEVDSLSDSFALKVKAKMSKKKPAKKIGNLKPNKKVDESKKTGLKGKMEKVKKR